MRVLFPGAGTLHPGHGDPGPAAALIDAHEAYTVAARNMVATALEAGNDPERIVAEVSDGLRRTYPDHGIPGGQPNMIELSVQGLVAELAELRAVGSGQ